MLAAFALAMPLALANAHGQAGLVLLQSHAEVFTSLDRDDKCKPPSKEWISLHDLQMQYGEDVQVDEMINTGLLETRQNPDIPSRTQYYVTTAPGKAWMSEKTLHEKYDQAAIEKMLSNGKLETRQNPDCPTRTQYFRWKRVFISEEKLHKFFNKATIKKLMRKGLIESRTNPHHTNRTQYFVHHKRAEEMLEKEAKKAEEKLQIAKAEKKNHKKAPTKAEKKAENEVDKEVEKETEDKAAANPPGVFAQVAALASKLFGALVSMAKSLTR